MTDPADRLIGAWLAWDHAPTSRPVCIERLDALAAAGFDSNAAHDHIAAMRRHGYSIPDAVQAVILDQRQEAA